MRSLQKYLNPHDYVLNTISFDYQNGRYLGRGVMRWNLDGRDGSMGA